MTKYQKPLLFLAVLVLVLSPTLAFGANDDDDPDSQEEQLNDTRNLIKEYEEKIAQLKAEERSLKNQIAQMNSEIYLTTLRIQESESTIEKKRQELAILSTDIEKLSERIQRLSESLDFQEDIFGQRARAAYKSTRVSFLEMFLLNAGNLGEFVSRYKYLQVLEERDRGLLSQMEKTRGNYQTQQDYLNQKKARAEEVKAQVEQQKSALEQQKADLVVQQADKEYLLNITQNDEVKYQELLNQALAERAAIESIFASLDFGDGEDVDEGDIIAVMGNTGAPDCSSGPHLHFEIRQDGTPTNPANYLEGQSVINDTCIDTSCDSLPNFTGDWEWPMKDPVSITQIFGMSIFARTIRGSHMYGGGPHTGIDMVNNLNPVIYAPKDGIAIKRSGYCGSSVYNYVAIDHGDDVVSLYLHVQ